MVAWCSTEGLALLRVSHIVQFEYVEGELLRSIEGHASLSLDRQVF